MSAPLDAVRAALRGGAWEDARAACLAALTGGHVGADVQYALGLSLVGLGDVVAAIAPLESAHAADPMNAAVARALGVNDVGDHVRPGDFRVGPKNEDQWSQRFK